MENLLPRKQKNISEREVGKVDAKEGGRGGGKNNNKNDRKNNKIK